MKTSRLKPIYKGTPIDFSSDYIKDTAVVSDLSSLKEKLLEWSTPLSDRSLGYFAVSFSADTGEFKTDAGEYLVSIFKQSASSIKFIFSGVSQLIAGSYVNSIWGSFSSFLTEGSLETGVVSFNGRTGTVSPATGDYTPDMVGISASGILKGNGTSVSAAEAGTDYAKPGLVYSDTVTGIASLDALKTQLTTWFNSMSQKTVRYYYLALQNGVTLDIFVSGAGLIIELQRQASHGTAIITGRSANSSTPGAVMATMSIISGTWSDPKLVGGDISGTVPVNKGGTGATTLAANAVVTGNGANAVKTVAAASGALYSTGAGVAPKFGVLPVAQGGTGNSSSDSAPTSGSTKMVTSGGVYTAFSDKLGRTNKITEAGAIGTKMARAIYAGTTDMTDGSTALTQGTIYLVYEA